MARIWKTSTATLITTTGNGEKMAGIKNPIQERNWHLPQADNSLTIEERDFLLRSQASLSANPISYCHFCGAEMLHTNSGGPGGAGLWEITEEERKLGAHLKCFRENMAKFVP